MIRWRLAGVLIASEQHVPDGVQVHTCGSCWSLVPVADLAMHERWHRLVYVKPEFYEPETAEVVTDGRTTR